MKIEIKITRSNLTKSLVKQIIIANPIQMHTRSQVLGYVINIVQNSYKTFIIESPTGYYLVKSGWKLSTDNISAIRENSRGSFQYKKFETKEDTLSFLNDYKQISRSTTHIYV